MRISVRAVGFPSSPAVETVIACGSRTPGLHRHEQPLAEQLGRRARRRARIELRQLAREHLQPAQQPTQIRHEPSPSATNGYRRTYR
ncbi:hypothetical protein ACWDBW_00735 [Streptomyces sp. NPDC001107]